MRRLLLLSICAGALAVPYLLAAQTNPSGDQSGKPGLVPTPAPAFASRFRAATPVDANRPVAAVSASVPSGSGPADFLVPATLPVARPGVRPIAVPLSRASGNRSPGPNGQAPIEQVQDRSIQPFSPVTVRPDAASGVVEVGPADAATSTTSASTTPVGSPVPR